MYYLGYLIMPMQILTIRKMRTTRENRTLLKYNLSLVRAFSSDISLELTALIPNFAPFLRLVFLGFNHKCIVSIDIFRNKYYLYMLAAKFYNCRSIGNTLLILIPLMVSKYAFLRYKRSYLFIK